MAHTLARAALISGSPSPTSRSRTLLERARRRLAALDCDAVVIDLASLPADALLGRRRDEQLARAIDTVAAANIIVASSPVYRATYSGLLKTFFDLLPQDALAAKVGVPILTGATVAHRLALDHGFRPLFASLGATSVSLGVYACDAQFEDGPDQRLLEQVDHAIDEAVALVPDPARRE
jgi:FMN reductase